jgi:hypothetical protein
MDCHVCPPEVHLETVYTTLIVPVATCKNEKVINKYEYR